MTRLLSDFRGLRLFLFALAALTALPSLQAADMRDHAESLGGVPADASFYMAWVKNREQIEIAGQSNAWRKLMTIPAVQMGMMQAQTWWQFPPDENLVKVKDWIESADGQEVLALVIEMASEEKFVYGDHSFTEMIQLAMEMNSEATRSAFEQLRETGDADSTTNEAVMKQKIAELVRRHKDKIKVPDLVVGFRIQDTARAKRVLDLVEEKLRPLLAEQSDLPLAENLVRKNVSGHDLLTLTLTEDLLPWDEIERDLDDAEMFDLLQETVAGKQVVLAIGIVEQFLVVSLGDSLDHFADVGSGPLLADTPEFERLSRHADERVVTVGYASEEFLEVANSTERSMKDFAAMAKGYLTLAKLDPERRDEIESDIDELAGEIVDYVPRAGALATTTFMTDRGYESFKYYWGEMPPNVDATQKLSLVNHVGDDSLGWLVGRGKVSIEAYDKAMDWLRRGFDHFEAIYEQKANSDDWTKYKEVRDEALPLLARIDNANRKMLLPGMADGQGALVFNASAADDEWCDFMSPAAQELPLPMLAMVQGVSDATLVKQAAVEYADVVQQVIDRLHEENPDEFHAFTIPEPEEQQVASGVIYSYDLPAEWGASDRIAPCAGLSDSVLVLSLMPELSEKLLAGSAPFVDGPIADFDRPLASAGHFKIARLIEMFKPWIEYGIQVAIENADDDAAAAVGMVGMVKPQVDQVLDVLQVFDSYTGVTYREDDAWVTHSELRIIDLED